MSRNPIRISKRGIAVDAGIILYGIVICLASILENIFLWILSIFGSIAIIALLRATKKADVSTARRNAPPSASDKAAGATVFGPSMRAPALEQELARGAERHYLTTRHLNKGIDPDNTYWLKDWKKRNRKRNARPKTTSKS